MAYQVVYSSQAQEEVREILSYLLNNWGIDVSENFSEYLINTIEMLASQPYAGRQHDLIKAVREFRVRPHYLVYYSVLEQQKLVHILNIIDSRRKP